MQLCITKFSPSICRPCHTFQYPEANPTQAAQQYLVLRLRKEVYGHTKPSAAHKGRNDTPALYNSDTPITVCKLSSDLSCRNLNLMNIQNYYTLMNFWIKIITLFFDVWLTVYRNSVWIGNQLDVTFVFLISLLQFAQHVSGNHVPIFRS